MPIIKVELTQAEQDARSKKLPKVKNIWKQSGYNTVIRFYYQLSVDGLANGSDAFGG